MSLKRSRSIIRTANSGVVLAARGDRLLDPFTEAGAVRQPGEAVVERLVPVLLGELAQLGLGLLVGGDVAADSLDARPAGRSPR